MNTIDPQPTTSAKTFLIEPFDINIQGGTPEGTFAMQARFANWLRGLNGPARFLCWQMPADLGEKIGDVYQALKIAEPERQKLLMEYRRSYEHWQSAARYHRTLSGMALWADESPQALAAGMGAAFDTPVYPAHWPALFEGRYVLRDGHLAPVGRPGGRPVWAVLTSYEFLPASWNFFKPLPDIFDLDFPLALCVDIAKTYDRHTATEKVESIIMAYQAHLVSSRGEDSRAIRRIQDCRRTLEQINDGDALHELHLSMAVAAYDVKTLRRRVQEVINETRAWFRLRVEHRELLSKVVQFFSTRPTKLINVPTNPWPVTSREAALAFSPLGVRRMAATAGVMRGEAIRPAYPVFHQSWRAEKQAMHELWVGLTGSGKTFALNCYLSREYAEQDVPFDFLEPMGHGRHLCQAFDLPWYVLSQDTRLNPQDVLYPTIMEQISHTIRIYETVMGRQLSSTQQSNLERGLLSEALEILYRGLPDFPHTPPAVTPTSEMVCEVLRGLGQQDHIKRIARDLADEIASLCTGAGPWARFLNGHTSVDFGRGGRERIGPRVFSFHELESDPVMVALAYTQVISAIRRDSLYDESPRIIAVDEVYRLMRHPSLVDFLVEGVKTFRTLRKKLIVIDQQMSIFLEGKNRLIFENCPIRVIFNQRQGMNVFEQDAAFQHLTPRHREVIANAPRYHFLFDVQDQGTYFLFNRPTDGELLRFGTT